MEIQKWEKSRVVSFFISILVAFGLYFPTSINGIESMSLRYLSFGILAVILISLIIIRKQVKFYMILSFLLINFILLTATLFSEYQEKSWGAVILYFLLSVMFCLNLKDLSMNKGAVKVFYFFNILNLVICYAVVFGQGWASSILIDNYSAFYPELLPNMMMRNKPVLTFATHSIAGFYLFIFFYLNLKTSEVTNKKFYFILSLLYLGLCYFLDSTTGYIFLLIGVVMLLRFVIKRNLLFLIFVAILVFFNINTVTATVQNTWSSLEEKFTSGSNGLYGRFSETGNLQNNLRYIADNPFRPVGVGYSEELMYADSGMIELTLRGSVLFMILIYASLFYFLRNNLTSSKTAYFLFISLMIFEIGFSNMTYKRTLFLLPVIILYLNYLECRVKSKEPIKEIENNIDTSTYTNKRRIIQKLDHTVH